MMSWIVTDVNSCVIKTALTDIVEKILFDETDRDEDS